MSPHQKTRLGITNDFHLAPIVSALREDLISHPFQLQTDSTANHVSHLKKGLLDLAFITPLEYAVNSGRIRLVRDFAVGSVGISRYAALFFQENLRNITEIGYDGNEDHYFYLCKIVLQEFFGLEPEWKRINFDSDLEQLLKSSQSIFMSGSMALQNSILVENNLDIAEEWYEKTDTECVHLVLSVRSDFEGPLPLEAMHLSAELGSRNLLKFSQKVANMLNVPWQSIFELWENNYKFIPTNETWNGLREYFQFLFYYGLTDYLTEIEFFR